MSLRRGFSTRSIHAREAPDPSTGAHGVPIYQNSTFALRSYDGVQSWREGAPHFLYARDGNPTVRCLELKLANLEGTEDAVATGTGMAAISGALLHLLSGGDQLLASADVYAVMKEFLQRALPGGGATVTLVDFGDPAAVEAAITPETRALFCEPFSNPRSRLPTCRRTRNWPRSAAARWWWTITFTHRPFCGQWRTGRKQASGGTAGG